MELCILFRRQLSRELVLQRRQVRYLLNTSLFFLMVVFFFPLTLSPDVHFLRTVAPGLVWIGMLFALFLSSERLFQQDYEDGVIEQWLVSGYPISLYVGAKILIHWLINLIPLLILSPILAIFFSLTPHETFVLMLSIFFGSSSILLLCAMAAACCTGLQQKGILMPLILLPLTIPIMIFGSSTLTASMEGLPFMGYLALLLAMTMLSAALLPFAIGAIIAVNLV